MTLQDVPRQITALHHHGKRRREARPVVAIARPSKEPDRIGTIEFISPNGSMRIRPRHGGQNFYVPQEAVRASRIKRPQVGLMIGFNIDKRRHNVVSKMLLIADD